MGGSIVRVMATLQWQLARFSHRLRLGGDALLAALLASVMGGTALVAGGPSIAMRLAGAVAACGLLVLVERRRRPLVVVIAVFAVVFAEELAVPHAFEVATFLAIMVATYSLGAHASKRVLALGLVLGAPLVAIGHALGKQAHYSDASADVFFFLVLVLGPVLVGRVVRARSQLASRLREATERLAAARSERVAATVAADRARLGERIDAALVEGLARMVALGECLTLEQVSALENIARDVLGDLRGLLVDLRAPAESLTPGRALSDVHARVQRAIEAGAALARARVAVKPVARRSALLSPRLIDAGLASLAAVVAAGLLANTLGLGTLRGPRPLDALLTVAVAAPIAWAQRSALEATIASIAATFAYLAVAAPADPGSGVLPIGLVLVFPLALGATCPTGRATLGLVLCLAAVGLGDAVDPVANFNPATVAPDFALVLGGWAAGRVLRDRGRMLGALADTAVAIEREREELAGAALAAERARIARELHDAVAHAMTVIVLQAAAARRVWATNPELAERHAGTLRKTVSELVTELRALLVALGGGNRGMGRVEQLIERARATGIQVGLEVSGNHATLAPSLQHTAYRVLQEALTNVARHAPGAKVQIHLDYEPAGVALEVFNESPQVLNSATTGSGHGLIGMRERVEVCGGRFAAGPEPPHQFAVRAWLPNA
jgi:signal transduction histidine kinase